MAWFILLQNSKDSCIFRGMNYITPVLFAALPALVAPAMAQQAEENISASDFVEAQLAIVKGMTELLTVKGIENDPVSVANGINQLAGMVQQLAALQPQATAEDAAIIETELADKARTAAQALQRALEATVERNFYNSQELADAIQNFAASFQALK